MLPEQAGTGSSHLRSCTERIITGSMFFRARRSKFLLCLWTARLAACRASWAVASERPSSGAASDPMAAPATVTCHPRRSLRCWPGLVDKAPEGRLR